MGKIQNYLKSILAKALFVAVNWLHKNPGIKIKKAFRKKYPKSSFATWQQIDRFTWEVSFILNKNEYKTFFDTNGNWLQTKHYVSYYNLPNLIKNNFRSYDNFKNLQKVLLIEKPDESLFEFQMNSGNGPYKIVVDINGNEVNHKAS